MLQVQHLLVIPFSGVHDTRCSTIEGLVPNPEVLCQLFHIPVSRPLYRFLEPYPWNISQLSRIGILVLFFFKGIHNTVPIGGIKKYLLMLRVATKQYFLWFYLVPAIAPFAVFTTMLIASRVESMDGEYNNDYRNNITSYLNTEVSSSLT